MIPSPGLTSLSRNEEASEMRATRTKIAASALLALFAVLLSGCGGKAGSSSTPALPPPAPVAQNLVIATSSLPNGTYGQFYSSGLKASGGTPPYTWVVANGDPLSAGLSLNQNTGVLNGVLTANTSFTAAVFDAKSRMATHDFTINATSGAVKLTTTVLPPATAQHRYDISLAINQLDSGSFTLQSGQLPAGLNLSNAGELS